MRNFKMAEHVSDCLQQAHVYKNQGDWVKAISLYEQILKSQPSNIDALYKDAQQSGATIFLAIEEKWYRVNDIEVGNRQFIVLDQLITLFTNNLAIPFFL